eukprot:2939527-Amphidinium_carterae.1
MGHVDRDIRNDSEFHDIGDELLQEDGFQAEGSQAIFNEEAQRLHRRVDIAASQHCSGEGDTPCTFSWPTIHDPEH